MLNELQKFAIDRFAEDIYSGKNNVKEAQFFLTHKQKLEIKAIEFGSDGRVTVVTNNNQTEFLFYPINTIKSSKTK